MKPERKLHLGCGREIRPDWINLDIHDYGQQIIRDMRQGLPFDDNSISEIYTHHALEHVEQGRTLEFVLRECLRVLKVGGVMHGIVPHCTTEQAFHAGHVSWWCEETINCMPGGGWPIEILECGKRVGSNDLEFKFRKASDETRLNFW